MSFTYTGDPSSSNRDAVRFYVQDTDPDEFFLHDAEIDFILQGVDDSIYQAAHDVCYVIAARFAKRADTSKSVGDMSLSVTYSNRAAEYRTMAERFLELGSRREPPLPRFSQNAMVNTAERDEPNPTTDFMVGQFDNVASRFGVSPYNYG